MQTDVLGYLIGKSDEEAVAKLKADATAVDKSAPIRVVADIYFAMRERPSEEPREGGIHARPWEGQE